MSVPTEASNGSIFLSYSRSDRDAAIAFRTLLERAGLLVFHDVQGIRAGDQWLTRLEDALRQCSAFVVLVGRDGVRRWVSAEVQVAINRHFAATVSTERLAIFPVLLSEQASDNLPPFLALFQATTWSAANPVDVTLVEAIRTRAIRPLAVAPFDGCPFIGLSAFQRKDAHLFFGRRQETLDALACLGSQRGANPERPPATEGADYVRWLQIEGNSGSGKSSLVNAGMLPSIEQGALWARTGFDRWRVVGPLFPGKDPLGVLAETLERCLVEQESQRDSLARLRRLEQDDRSLAFSLRDAKADDTAFLLFVDQFEELFTFADVESRKRFDAALAYALQDPQCPLFLITTVRTDFLDRFEELPHLQAIYNRCKRFFLSTMTERGLREAIEEPARLAGLDVREVAAAIIEDARDELGALPLVENALLMLWREREGNVLSGEHYRRHNGIAGILSSQADALLARIDREVRGGKLAALEVLLRLTRINEQGRNTRERIAREEAVHAAGNGEEKGERVLQLLSGERAQDGASPRREGALRLVTILTEHDTAEAAANGGIESGGKARQFVDLIHETLIRARPAKEPDSKPLPYWPTLFDYIEKNRDRPLHRLQLRFQTELWQSRQGLGRWSGLASLPDLGRYRHVNVRDDSAEGRYLARSKAMAWARLSLGALVSAIAAVFAASAVWVATQSNPSLPTVYALYLPFWWLGYIPEPEMVELASGTFIMGCVAGRDDTHHDCPKNETPPVAVTFDKPFTMGKYEVTFRQYDAYVYDQRRRGNVGIDYPLDHGFGRDNHPVFNVSWQDAHAYVDWLRRRTGRTYQLPTESQWEYGARAGGSAAYWWGGEFEPAKANCDGQRTQPVGRFPENPFHLHDTAGNVAEWVDNRYEERPSGSAMPTANQSDEGVNRVVRGGAWLSEPQGCRASSRNSGGANSRFPVIGFRVCCSSPN